METDETLLDIEAREWSAVLERMADSSPIRAAVGELAGTGETDPENRGLLDRMAESNPIRAAAGEPAGTGETHPKKCQPIEFARTAARKARLSQSGEHEILNLRVVGSCPHCRKGFCQQPSSFGFKPPRKKVGRP